MALVCAAISLISVLLIVVIAFKQKGVVSYSQAFASLLSVVIAFAGIVLCTFSFYDKEQYHNLTWIALVGNSITVILVGTFIYFGI